MFLLELLAYGQMWNLDVSQVLEWMMVRGGGVERLLMTMDSHPASNCSAVGSIVVVPYPGWLGHIFLAMQQLRQLKLKLRVGEVGPHLRESDMSALHMRPRLMQLHISLETEEQLPSQALHVISSLTQLTLLSLGLATNCLDFLTGLSSLQCLQSLRLHNVSFSGFTEDFSLEGISTKLTHLGLTAMVDGFPDIAALQLLQQLESSCWFPGDPAPVPSS